MIRKKTLTKEKALERMAAMCARAEHCEWEIRDKLRRGGLSSSDAEEVIDYLVRRRFVDDARYARAYASDRVRFAGHGRLKIRMALAARHIDSHIIAAALESIDHDVYAESLMKTARSRASSLDMGDYADRAKLYRRLMSRGYESPLVTSAIRALVAEHNARSGEGEE